tara:strand:- start:911 stop:1330 length:420 start_codon:yes stop_codon:yes gene_type:complete
MFEDKSYEAEINERNSLDANEWDSMSLTNISLTQDAYQESLLNDNIESRLAKFYIEDKEDIVDDIIDKTSNIVRETILNHLKDTDFEYWVGINQNALDQDFTNLITNLIDRHISNKDFDENLWYIPLDSKTSKLIKDHS